MFTEVRPLPLVTQLNGESWHLNPSLLILEPTRGSETYVWEMSGERQWRESSVQAGRQREEKCPQPNSLAKQEGRHNERKWRAWRGPPG